MADYALWISLRSDGLFTASFPDVPDAVAYGRDEEEAVEEAAKSLESALRRRFLSGEQIPEAKSQGPIRIRQDVLAAVLA